MGGKNDSQTQTVSNLPPGYVRKAQKFGLGEAQNLYQNVPFADPNTAYAGLNAPILGGIFGKFGAGQQLGGQVGEELGKTLSGAYLSGQNPYIDQVVNRAQESTAARLNATFGGAGRTGGGLHQKALTEGLGNVAASIYAPAYEAERGRQQQAINQVGQAFVPYQEMMQAGGVLQQDELNRQLAEMATANLPYTQLQQYGGFMGPFTSGAGTVSSQTTPGRGALAGAAGGALAGSALGPWGAVGGGILGGLGIL